MEFNYNVYITVSDKLVHLLPETVERFNKYWSSTISVTIFGYSELNFDLPDNFKFISMGEKDRGPEYWVEDLYKAFSNIEDDFFIWFVDDTWFDAPINLNMINNICPQHLGMNVNWFGLTIGPSERAHNLVKDYGEFQVIELEQTAPYRVTCQVNIWNRDRVLHYLSMTGRDSNKFSWPAPGEPWHWELFGSHLAINDGYNIYAFKGIIPVDDVLDGHRRGDYEN